MEISDTFNTIRPNTADFDLTALECEYYIPLESYRHTLLGSCIATPLFTTPSLIALHRLLGLIKDTSQSSEEDFF